MKEQNGSSRASVFGIDIGKNVFHVVGVDVGGQPVQKARFRRESLLQFFERTAPALIGMESCPGSQWLGPDHSSPVRQTLCEEQQERHH